MALGPKAISIRADKLSLASIASEVDRLIKFLKGGDL